MRKFKGRIFTVALIFLAAIAVFSLSIFAISNSKQPTPVLEIAANNISFSNNLYLKYAVRLENIDSSASVKLLIWTTPVGEYVLGTEDYVIESDGTSKVNGEECLIFDYKEISAKKMTDVIYARAYVESNGEIYYSDVKKYSVLQYVYNKLGYTGTATQNEELAALLNGLLEYGASAQTFFEYKTDTLATDKFVKITLTNAVFADGSNYALVKEGTSITALPVANDELGLFMHWTDLEGNYITDSSELQIIAGNTNSTYLAVFEAYGGANIDGVGAVLDADGLAANGYKYDEEDAISISASNLESILASLPANSVYRVTDGNILNITSTVNGNKSVIIAPAGVTVSGDNITVSDLVIIGEVTVTNSDNLTLHSVGIASDNNGINIDTQSNNLKIDDCYITAGKNAIDISSDNATVLNSFVSGNVGINANANGAAVYNTKVIAKQDAIVLFGKDCAVNKCTLSAGVNYTGITVSSDSVNTLVTYNKITGAKESVKVSGATNTVVLFNSIYNAKAEAATNTYIVENALGGTLHLSNNNYLLCDENVNKENKVEIYSVSEGNQNTNGNNLMDVTARNEVGAKEELLPHTNKDLFLDMERKTTVKDVVNGTSFDLNAYIEENAKVNSVVIVPPGAYSTGKGDFMDLTKAMSDTDIYAFGVYNEHAFVPDYEYLETKKTNYILLFSSFLRTCTCPDD